MKKLILGMLLVSSFAGFASDESESVEKEGWMQAYDFNYFKNVSYYDEESISSQASVGYLTAGGLVALHPGAAISSTSLNHCGTLYHRDSEAGFKKRALSKTAAFFEYMTSCFIKTPAIPFSAAGDALTSTYESELTGDTLQFSSEATKGTSSGLDGYADVLAATQQETLEQLAAVVEGMDEEMPLATAMIDGYIASIDSNATRAEAALAIIENV